MPTLRVNCHSISDAETVVVAIWYILERDDLESPRLSVGTGDNGLVKLIVQFADEGSASRVLKFLTLEETTRAILVEVTTPFSIPEKVPGIWEALP